MSRPTGENRYFPKVKEAREALQAKALELHEYYMTIVHMAMEKGDLETALKAVQWLHEHMPRGAGDSMIDISIDKPKQIEAGPRGPQVNIGFALGGINEPKALPTVTIDVEPVDVLDTEANVESDG